MIDSHVHFWNPNDLDYDWLEATSPLYRAFLPTDYEPGREACGVSGAVFVQASHDPRENAWAFELADRFEWLLGVVGWVDLEAEDVRITLEHLSQHRRFKGVRHLVHNEADERWLLRPKVGAGLEALGELGLSFDLILRPEQFQYAPGVVAAHPELLFVLDHLGSPTGETLRDWARTLERLAGHANVTAKISGLPRNIARHAISIALETFGSNRLMLGGDYPICTLELLYATALTTMLEALRGLAPNGLHSITTAKAAHVYRLSSDRA